MSRTDAPLSRRQERLQAHLDGELRGLERWRFERQLRKDPNLRRELEALHSLGDWVRDSHEEGASPDIWDSLALQLPRVDAEREEQASSGGAGIGWLAWPGAAATATVGLVAALWFGGWFEPGVPPATGGVVRWLDSGARDVMVLEGASDTTIIWVFDSPQEGASEGERRDVV